MSYEDLIQQPLWNRMSEKISTCVLLPHNCGRFTAEDAQARAMKCVEANAGELLAANATTLYWLVDPSDGMIVDAKFQVFGPAALIAAAEASCELVIGKNYEQARRIGAELIDKWLRDHPSTPAFPNELFYLVNLVLEAIKEAAHQCSDIPLSQIYHSPLPESLQSEGYPGWIDLPTPQKLAVIEKILNEEVRPYVELDEGGIEVQALTDHLELIIAYQGACTSCFSSIGATLSTIQQILQNKVHPDLKVTPNMEALNL